MALASLLNMSFAYHFFILFLTVFVSYAAVRSNSKKEDNQSSDNSYGFSISDFFNWKQWILFGPAILTLFNALFWHSKGALQIATYFEFGGFLVFLGIGYIFRDAIGDFYLEWALGSSSGGYGGFSDF